MPTVCCQPNTWWNISMRLYILRIIELTVTCFCTYNYEYFSQNILIMSSTGGCYVRLGRVFPHSEADIQYRKCINVFVYLIDLDGCHMNCESARQRERWVFDCDRRLSGSFFLIGSHVACSGSRSAQQVLTPVFYWSCIITVQECCLNIWIELWRMFFVIVKVIARMKVMDMLLLVAKWLAFCKLTNIWMKLTMLYFYFWDLQPQRTVQLLRCKVDVSAFINLLDTFAFNFLFFS